MPSHSTSAGWGGRRPGAGRKRPTTEPLFAREVRLTMPQMAFLARYGQGQFIRGLRRLVDEALAREAAAPTDGPRP
jgi:hypothetical protein